MERRLAAILAADVVGYTALMGADESGTLRRLTDLRQCFLEPLIGQHRGRIVKLMGDGILVEFSSVVDAVDCALAWQEGVTEREEAAQEGKRLHFRIGINLGDVIVEREDIHGDGVNIATRLEGLAEPGEICISGDAYRQAKGKTEADFEDMGERNLKNVSEPVRVYRVAGFGTGVTGAGTERVSLALPDKPSIAVVPFTNMSGDIEQEYFSDGITEDIITALSKIASLLVVARNSTFTYKGRAVDVREVSREQGVRYVLEGSVRKAGTRIRVTSQLIDAKTGHHLWAERYDRNLEDIFAVQDEITREIVVALDVHLSAGEQARVWSSSTRNLEAWECVRRAMELLNSGTPEAPKQALQLCEKALNLDTDYVMAWVTLGWTHHHGVDVGLGQSSAGNREEALISAIECGNKALELDPDCADAYALLSLCHLSRGEFAQAAEMSERSVSLAPSHAEILALSAMVQNKSGQPKRSLDLIKKAIRHCPIYPGWFLQTLATAYRLTGQVPLSVATFEAAIRRDPDFLAIHVGLASTLGEIGRTSEASKTVSEILRLDPDFSIRSYTAGLSYKDPAELERFENGLRLVGLPE